VVRQQPVPADGCCAWEWPAPATLTGTRWPLRGAFLS